MTHTPEETYRLQKSGLAWLVAYLATLALVIGLLYQARERVMTTLDTPEAQAEWDEWRDAAEKQSVTGPVARRKPKSVGPPAVVLMRDYFGIALGASIVLSSALFATIMFMVRGALKNRHTIGQTTEQPSGR
jgi:hypothetical protein